jgi:hypothetical protein
MSTTPSPSARTPLLAIAAAALTIWAINTHEAAGYPAGSVISTGSNPIVAMGGRLAYSGDSHTLFTAPADQNIVVTDVVLTGVSTTYDCRGQSRVTLATDSTSNLANYSVDQRAQSNSRAGAIVMHYESGLPIPAGESLYIQTEGNYQSCGTYHHHVDYSVSGYLAQP